MRNPHCEKNFCITLYLHSSARDSICAELPSVDNRIDHGIHIFLVIYCYFAMFILYKNPANKQRTAFIWPGAPKVQGKCQTVGIVQLYCCLETQVGILLPFNECPNPNWVMGQRSGSITYLPGWLGL